MGVGAYASKWSGDRPVRLFIYVEYLLGLIGGLSVPLLYLTFVNSSLMAFQLISLGVIFIIGFLTGLEIPLLTFSFDDKEIKDSLAQILGLDYVGGLVATLIFPFFVLPFIGLFQASLLFGMVNVLLGLIVSWALFRSKKSYILWGLAAFAVLLILLLQSNSLLNTWEQKIYKQPIIVNEQSPYQKIVVTKRDDVVKLFINRVIQFSSDDEHRYHEAIVHVPMLMTDTVHKVLILGGGEQLATREVLKYPMIKQVDVVDIDSTIFELAMENTEFQKINQFAPMNPRVHMIVDDAFSYLYHNTEKYDVIIGDLPDPSNQALARLYSKQFFKLVRRALSPEGVFITQSGDINNSPQVFSCIHNTLKEAFDDQVSTFHVHIPSFGTWGFNIGYQASTNEINAENLPDGLRFLNASSLSYGQELPKDVPILHTDINTLDHPALLQYFLTDYAQFKENSGGNWN